MSITTQLTHSNEAWKLLRGLICLYKPPGYPASSLYGMLKNRITDDLNCMERAVYSDEALLPDPGETGIEEAREPQVIVSSQGTEIVSSTHIRDYSTHPSVLGPGFHHSDHKVYGVNILGDKSSGVCLIGLNDGGVSLARAVKRARLMSTYHIKGEFGRATRTGWYDGKTAKCEGWKYIRKRTHLLEQLLVNISSAHQSRVWEVAEVGVDSQEAYELACKGPVRPKMISESLVYNISLLEAELPHFTLELQVVEGSGDQDQGHLVRLVEELAIKCRTVASVHSVRCTALGPWTAGDSMLFKHIDLKNVLNNISENRKIHREFLARPGNLFSPNIMEKKSKLKQTQNQKLKNESVMNNRHTESL